MINANDSATTQITFSGDSGYLTMEEIFPSVLQNKIKIQQIAKAAGQILPPGIPWENTTDIKMVISPAL